MALPGVHTDRGDLRVHESLEELGTDLVDYIDEISETSMKERETSNRYPKSSTSNRHQSVWKRRVAADRSARGTVVAASSPTVAPTSFLASPQPQRRRDSPACATWLREPQTTVALHAQPSPSSFFAAALCVGCRRRSPPPPAI
ncbi:hypothetical protein Q3G72_014886 [Acer saccharum]|nr:hypothetical protein Q3G72_014886 [Acer saccharum]